MPRRRSRPGFQSSIFLLLLALVAAGGLFSAPAPAVHAEPVEATQGSLEWGVKTSFRSYAGGAMVSDGATLVDPINTLSSINWPLVSGTVDTDTGHMNVQFGGTAHFQTHCGATQCALDVTVANPRIEITASSAILYADVWSRNFSGSIIHYPDVAFVDLHPELVTPIVAGANVIWESIPSSLAATGYDAFAGFYNVGQELDPATICTGPCVLEEFWTAPGTPIWDPIEQTSAPAGITMMFYDAANNEFFATGNNIVYVLDGTTLASKASVAATMGNASGRNIVFDAAHRTLFIGAGSRVRAATWNGTTLTIGDIATAPGGGSGFGAIAYDALNDRVYAVQGASSRFFYRFDKTESGWTVTEYGAMPDWSTKGNAYAMLVDSAGTLLISRQFSCEVEIADFSTTPPTFTPIPDACGSTLRAAPDGRIYAVSSSVLSLVKTGGIYAVQGAPVPSIDGTRVQSTAIDPVTGTFYGPAYTAQLLSVRNGVELNRATITDMAMDYQVNLAIGANSQLFAIKGGKVYRLTQAAESPSVTQQPQDVTITLESGEVSQPVSFTTAVTGNPQPTVQWQSKDASGFFWSDIEGAASTTLNVTATAAMDGRQYRAVVTNEAGSMATRAATLTVMAGEPEPEPGSATQTITTSVVSSGGLSLSVGNTEVTLPSPVLNGAGDALVSSGSLNPVTVTDLRSANPGWNLNGQVSDFTSGSDNFSGNSLGWSPNVVSQSESQNVTAGAEVAPGGNLGSGAGLASAGAGEGRGTAVVGADLNLAVPTNTPAGTYSATLTITVI